MPKKIDIALRLAGASRPRFGQTSVGSGLALPEGRNVEPRFSE
jgi:hypothetical protein